MRTGVTFIAALVFCWSVFASAPAVALHCESIEAKCAVEIGGACDPVKSHWEYGAGHGLGGNTAAFNACLARHGATRPVELPAHPSTHGNSPKCTSVQARCAVEIGASCNQKTGFWCVGRGVIGNNYCGGTAQAWLACLDRMRAPAQK